MRLSQGAKTLNMNSMKRDSGFVSIFSVMIIMSVLTLVAVGFSNITRSAQRRTLDNQLSTQAFYAAESGVNDARTALATTPNLTKNECQGTTAGFNYGNLDSSLDVSYTCVLINSQLDDIRFDSVPLEGTASPKVVAFESSNNVPIRSFQVTWDAASTATGATVPNVTGYPNVLPPSGSWNADRLGMLRIDLAPTNGSLDRNNITTGSFTFFLYPSTNVAASNNHTVNNGTAGQGGMLYVRCPAASPCTTTINLNSIAPTLPSSKYVMRLQSVYNSVETEITNVHDGLNLSGNVLTLQNGQTIVDSTGRAADVLRRIQARLPIAVTGQLPSFAIQSADTICKRLLVGSVTIVDGSVTDPACSLDPPGTPVPPDPPVACTTCFPGDPRPFGRAYWGASIGGNGDPSRHENAAGVNKSLAARRTYWQWDDAKNTNSNMYKVVADDTKNNRLPFISIKPPEVSSGSAWKKVADGNFDADLDKMLKKLDTYNEPVWVVFHHEPEGGGSSGNAPDDPGGAPEWRRMQKHVRERMDALGTKNLALVPILMAYTWDPVSKRVPNDWWEPAARWDAYVVDIFRETADGDMFTDGSWADFVSWIKAPSRNIPFGTGEWGNTCKLLSCAATAAAGGTEAANEMQAFWDAGFPVNDKNVVIHSYFDSSLNSGDNNWVLQGEPLKKFRNIMQNDKRVMRINDL